MPLPIWALLMLYAVPLSASRSISIRASEKDERCWCINGHKQPGDLNPHLVKVARLLNVLDMPFKEGWFYSVYHQMYHRHSK